MFKLKGKLRKVEIGAYFYYQDNDEIFKIVGITEAQHLCLAYIEKHSGKFRTLFPSSINTEIYLDALRSGDYKEVPEEEVLNPTLKAYKFEPHV